MGRAIVPMTRKLVRNALDLPPETEIIGLYIDPDTDCVLVVIQDDRIEDPIIEGNQLRRILPRVRRGVIYPYEEVA